MFVLLVYLHVKPEHLDEFRQATLEKCAQQPEGAGRRALRCHPGNRRPTRFALVEAYRSREGLARHREAAHYQAWAAKVADWLAEPRSRTTYDGVDPSDAEW